MKKFYNVIFISLIVILLTACSTSKKMIGCWNGSDGANYTFYKDGTFSINSLLVNATGNYSFIAKDTIKLEFDGILGITGAQIATVTLQKRQILFNTNNIEIVLTKSKNCNTSNSNSFIPESNTQLEVVQTDTPQNTPTPTIPPVDDDIQFYLISYSEAETFVIGDQSPTTWSGDPGMKLLKFQIAVANTSLTDWKNIYVNFDSVTTQEGYEYPREKSSAQCSLGPVKASCTSPSTGLLTVGNNPAVSNMPPGIQSLTEEVLWEVAEASSNYSLNITIKTEEGLKFQKTIPLSEENIQPFLTPFTGNISWNEYKNQPLENIQPLEIGQSQPFDYGIFKPIGFTNDEDGYVNGIWKFNYEITNTNPAYSLNLDTSNESYFFDGGMGYLRYFSDIWASVGPNQTNQFSSLISCSFSTFNPSHGYPVSVESAIKPLCEVIKNLEWRDENGNKNKTEMNIITCME
jgi:hypothetical protein